jgi:hypothetical protein
VFFETGSPAVRGQHRPRWRVLKKGFLRRIFGSKRDEAHRRAEKNS